MTEKRQVTSQDIGLANTMRFVPSNPTGTSSTANPVMMGLGQQATPVVFTPKKTGRIEVILCCQGQSDTASDGFSVLMYYGTGTAPANGAAEVGTGFGQSVTSSPGTLALPLTMVGTVSSLTIGTQVWIDLALEAITGGTASLTNLIVIIKELLN